MTKKEIRKIYLEKRLLLPEADYQLVNQNLLSQFAKLDFSSVSAIHIFLSMLRTREPDTSILIRFLKQHYPQIKRVFPQMNFKSKSLTNFLDDNALVISENEYGISEPASGNRFYIDKNSMIIVPLLAFDKSGNRVGYGGGFYDRFLADCEAGTRFIGLSLFEPVVKIDDPNDFDVKLHQCITPEKIWTFG